MAIFLSNRFPRRAMRPAHKSMLRGRSLNALVCAITSLVSKIDLPQIVAPPPYIKETGRISLRFGAFAAARRPEAALGKDWFEPAISARQNVGLLGRFDKGLPRYFRRCIAYQHIPARPASCCVFRPAECMGGPM
jgi:hypothetical protein